MAPSRRRAPLASHFRPPAPSLSLPAISVWVGVAIGCGGSATVETTPGAANEDVPSVGGNSGSGSGSSESVGNEGLGTEGSMPARDCPTGGDPQPPIAFLGEPLPSSTSTTPTELTVCLNQDVDRLIIQSQVQVEGGPVSSCSTSDILRIGRTPTAWEMGTTRVFDVSYPERLPPGRYVEWINAVVAGSDYDYLGVERTARFFEVDGDGMRPISNDAYSSSPAAFAPPLELAEPCPELARYADVPNDEVPADQTVSLINLDDWANVAAIQPLRHEVQDLEQPVLASSALRFSAWNSRGDRVRLQLEYQPRAGVAFESDQFSLQLQSAARVDWYSNAGHVVVRDLGGEQLEVRLTGVVLEKGRTIEQPIVTRALPDGTISASVVRLCRTPISEFVDAGWTSPYCGQIRQAAGF